MGGQSACCITHRLPRARRRGLRPRPERPGLAHDIREESNANSIFRDRAGNRDADPGRDGPRAGTVRRINGIVTDASDAVLPGATVTITSKTTGAIRTVVTNSDGGYHVPDLDPGRYAVTVELMGFARVELQDVNVLLGRTLKVDATLKVGDFSEVVNVTADETPAIDTRSTLVAHNVTAEEIERMPKGRSFQSLALTAPSVNSGRDRRRHPGERRQRRRERLHRRRRGDQQPDQRAVAPEHRVRVPAGSAGQDDRHRGGVRRRARRRHQRGHQVGRQHGARRGALLLRGQRAGGGPGEAPRPRSRRTTSRVSYVQDKEQPDHRSEFGGSIGGPIVRDRLFYFGSYSPRIGAHDQRLPVQQRHRARRDRARPDCTRRRSAR